MKYGPIVARRFKKQYFKRKKWNTYDHWDLQPEEIYLILRELSSKKSINALMGNESWTKRLPRVKVNV